MKFLITLIVLFSSTVNFIAQDWNSWSFHYNFSIKSIVSSPYKVDSLDVMVDDPFGSTKFQKGVILLNDSTKKYSIGLAYGCISCGYADTKFPPTVYLRLYSYDTFHKEHFSVLIPISFEETTDTSIFDLGTININDFIHHTAPLDRYEGLNIKSDGTVFLYKKGELAFPSPNKLISVNLINSK